MPEYHMTTQQVEAYQAWLRREERAKGTREKYLRDLRAFRAWLEDRGVDKEQVAAWKGHLLEQGYAPVTVNSMLASLHSFFPFCRVDRVPSEVCVHPAAALSGKSAGADPPGLSTPHRYRPQIGENQVGTAVGEHCRHRRAGVRGALPHRGGGPKGQGGDLPEGENLLL